MLVTGASSGLGKSIAKHALKETHRVILVARRGDQLKNIVNEIGKPECDALIIPADISIPSQVRSLFDDIHKFLGTIDIVFHCAGTVEPIGPINELSPESIYNSLMANCYGSYLVLRESVVFMRGQLNGGTIVGISSGAAEKPYHGWSMYCSQKALLNMVIKCISVENVSSSIRAFTISPGPFESPMQETIRDVNNNQFPSRDKFITLYNEGKLMPADYFGKMIFDICSTDWPELNGENIDLRSEEFLADCVRMGLVLPNQHLQK